MVWVRLWRPPEAPKLVKDPWNVFKSIRGGWGQHLGPISDALGLSRAVFLAGIAQSGPFWAQKRCFFGPKSFFCGQPQKNCYNIDRTPKRQPFCVDCIAGWSPAGRPGPVLAQNWPKNLFLLRFTYITHLCIWSQSDPTQWDHNNCIKFYGIWCFIFVFHEEHRKCHKYPEYWVQMWKS